MKVGRGIDRPPSPEVVEGKIQRLLHSVVVTDTGRQDHDIERAFETLHMPGLLPTRVLDKRLLSDDTPQKDA